MRGFWKLGLLGAAWIPSLAAAQDTVDSAMVTLNTGSVLLGQEAITGAGFGVTYRSEMNFFAFEAEPFSMVYDDFGGRTGIRLGFLHPGVRFMLFPDQQVSPNVGASIGFSYTVASPADGDVDFASIAWEARVSAGVDFARQSRVRPVLRVDLVLPTRDNLIFDQYGRTPPVLLANFGVSFPTRVSAMRMIEDWF